MESLNFDNRALQQLPLDPEPKNYVRTVAGACFSRVRPAPVDNPSLVSCSDEALALLGVDPRKESAEKLAEYFSGCSILPGSDPAAHCYCGHQFGYFSGQLGDGATMYLGEVVNASGKRWELQLKGAGKTPYSRTADGRKVLRSSIREFLCSEAMFHLGVPTTRAGTCVTSDTKVIRDIFYSGNPIEERCTVISRIAPSFIRFGSFEIFKTRDVHTARMGPSVGRNDIKQQLLEYCISTFFPQIDKEASLQQRGLEFYRQVVISTAILVSRWQSVGFCHGVLNTDNMSILGLTIDYGPFGFMDHYDPDFICNGSDDAGRYRFSSQPEVCGWNLRKFAESLDPIVPLSDSIQILKDEYLSTYEREYLARMRRKLGLSLEQETDLKLVEELLDTMHKTGSDFTNTFRALSMFPIPGVADFDASKDACLDKLLSHCATIEELRKLNEPKMDHKHLESIMQLMQQTPQLADERLVGQIMNQLEKFNNLNHLEKKSEEQKRADNRSLWTPWLEMYAARLAMEAGEDVSAANASRVAAMNGCNPIVVFRNYVAQAAIEAAERGDYSEVNRVLELVKRPYDTPPSHPHSEAVSDAATPHGSATQGDYSEKPPFSSLGISVT